MDDLITASPMEIQCLSQPRISSRIAREFIAIGKIDKIDDLNTNIMMESAEEWLQVRVNTGDEQAPFQLGKIQLETAEGCKLFEEIIQLTFKPTAPLGQRDLVYYAAYNLGRAYYQGYGYYPCIEKAIEYFKMAANNGDPKASILAQTALGYIYCEPEQRDLEQAFYWHTEACGNGSVESQAALGVMYLYGLGVKQDWPGALLCLSESAERGSLYGKATLAFYYYKRKMYTNAALIASKIAFFDVKTAKCVETDCLKLFLERSKAMACFIYARCLQRGLGVKRDDALAKRMFSQYGDQMKATTMENPDDLTYIGY